MAARLLAIDPAVHSIAYAIFVDKVLRSCGIQHGQLYDFQQFCFNARPNLIAVEQPHATSRRPVDYNDLIGLANTVGACCGAGLYVLVKPHEWKGTADKDVWWRTKTLPALSVGEATLVRKNHNVRDAVGIGLHVLRRY